MTAGRLVRVARRGAGKLVRAARRAIGREPSSVAEGTGYPKFCERAATDDETFATFKRQPVYTQILEHVTCEQGELYLRRLCEQSPEWSSSFFHRFRENDRLGSPHTCEYGEYGSFSPTTLRYAKVLSDLVTFFGALDGLRIVEIGGGYGGQSLLTSMVSRFAVYTLIDLEPVLALQRRYLAEHAIEAVEFVAATAVPTGREWDLAISNYAFSECTRRMQDRYMERVLQRSARGYLTYNWMSPSTAGMPYTRGELLAAVPGSRFAQPIPQLATIEELWLWGDDATSSRAAP